MQFTLIALIQNTIYLVHLSILCRLETFKAYFICF